MSRTALDGFPLGDIEKDVMLNLIKRYSALYFVDILGFCLMGNHIHILIKTLPEYKFTDDDIKKRYVNFYGDERVFADGLVPSFNSKNEKKPKPVKGLSGVYSLKRLSEVI